jgi:hypothetical protein
MEAIKEYPKAFTTDKNGCIHWPNLCFGNHASRGCHIELQWWAIADFNSQYICDLVWKLEQDGQYNSLDGKFLKEYQKGPKFQTYGKLRAFKGSSYDNGYFGLNVTSTSSERDTMIETIINNVALKRKIPVDDSSLFLFLASPEIRNEGFCEDYCGYHSYFEHIIQANEVLAKNKAVGSKTYPTYAFIGSGCDLGCGPAAIFSTPAPINYALDQMSTVVSHEIVEIISDPEPGSGFVENISGEENADLCVYCYNHVYRDKNGAYYNFFVGNDKFMLQANYDAINKQCV